MNSPEQFSVGENMPTTDKEALFGFRDGFVQLRKYAEQLANGADVGPELEDLRQALRDRFAKAMEDIESEGTKKGKQPELI